MKTAYTYQVILQKKPFPKLLSLVCKKDRRKQEHVCVSRDSVNSACAHACWYKINTLFFYSTRWVFTFCCGVCTVTYTARFWNIDGDTMVFLGTISVECWHYLEGQRVQTLWLSLDGGDYYSNGRLRFAEMTRWNVMCEVDRGFITRLRRVGYCVSQCMCVYCIVTDYIACDSYLISVGASKKYYPIVIRFPKCRRN